MLVSPASVSVEKSSWMLNKKAAVLHSVVQHFIAGQEVVTSLILPSTAL
jgi:hypothetical protein